SASPETIRREPQEFDLRRSVGKQQDLAACAPCNPVMFLPRRLRPPWCGGLLKARMRAFHDRPRADRPPSSWPRPRSHDCRSPSAFPFHRPEPTQGSVWAPASRPPPVRAEYVCCAVSKEVTAEPYLRNSFLLRRVRSS